VLAFDSVPNEFGLDRWLIDYQEAGRSAGLRPIHDATRAGAIAPVRVEVSSPASVSTGNRPHQKSY
jgi:hypothetical protein